MAWPVSFKRSVLPGEARNQARGDPLREPCEQSLSAEARKRRQSANSLEMSHELILQSITAIYAVCNAVRLLFYVPQVMAVARERSGAYAISIITWTFWSFSHAVTAVYCYAVIHDALLSFMMWGNAFGCIAVVALTMVKRHRYGWRRESNCPGADLSKPNLAGFARGFRISR